MGADLRGKRVLVVDDVITAGTAIRESMAMLRPLDATVTCVVVALDRQEVRDTDTAVPKSAIELLSDESGVRVISVVELNHLIEFVRTQEVRVCVRARVCAECVVTVLTELTACVCACAIACVRHPCFSSSGCDDLPAPIYLCAVSYTHLTLPTIYSV